MSTREAAEAQQRLTFTRWANLALTSRGLAGLPDGEDIVKAFASGVHLVRLVAALLGSEPPKFCAVFFFFFFFFFFFLF
jgi:hypothetical protein